MKTWLINLTTAVVLILLVFVIGSLFLVMGREIETHWLRCGIVGAAFLVTAWLVGQFFKRQNTIDRLRKLGVRR